MVGQRCSQLFLTVVWLTRYIQAEWTDGGNCVRPCTNETAPKSCYYEFHVEDYEVMGVACDFCTPNATNYLTNDCQCVVGDGTPRTAVTINRMLPGPAIYVCEGDQVIVDVTNLLDGAGTSVHWHGITQRGTQYSDGVPFVTQCPISSGATFRYSWTADTAGTYFYHSHSGIQLYNGMAGSLIVYPDQNKDPNGDLYDVDSWETVIILQDWKHERTEQVLPGLWQRTDGQEPANILVNGKGVYYDSTTLNTTGSYAEFNVTQGLRYRFRMINAFASVCPVSFRIENHTISVISADGVNVDPMPVDSIISMTGERYDFILNATQENGTYWIQLRGLGECEPLEVFQLAVLRYGDAELDVDTALTVDNPLPDGVVLNPVTYNYTDISPESKPVTELVNSIKDYAIRDMTPNHTYYLPFAIYRFADSDTQEAFYTVGTYEHHTVNTNPNLALVSNISFENPTSPLLSQYGDIDHDTLCDPSSCSEEYCTCTNVLKLKLGEIIDIFIVDVTNLEDLFHPIHLHGTKYYVLDIGFAKDLNLTTISADEVQVAWESGALDYRHNNDYPPGKDTVAVPTNGYAHVRFVVDNPGFWFMHCHVDIHMGVGMDLVVQVGEHSDMPPVPDGFPKCGNFVPKVETPRH